VISARVVRSDSLLVQLAVLATGVGVARSGAQRRALSARARAIRSCIARIGRGVAIERSIFGQSPRASRRAARARALVYVERARGKAVSRAAGLKRVTPLMQASLAPAPSPARLDGRDRTTNARRTNTQKGETSSRRRAKPSTDPLLMRAAAQNIWRIIAKERQVTIAKLAAIWANCK
jgi:hypothetical protein